jgi:hypothetical protein
MDSFFSSELERALEEQSFGISAFELEDSTSSLESSALVTLLEGNVVTILLSSRGYQVWQLYYYHFVGGITVMLEQLTKSAGGASPPRMGRIYEAIESLLQSISPLYERKRRENLFAQLERWS